MDGSNVYVSHAGVLGQDRQERNERIVMILSLVVENDSRFLCARFTNRRVAHRLGSLFRVNHL